MNASPLKTFFLFIGFLGAVLAKFWLIWESEIADASDDPHEYVLQILYPVNGGLAYGPGTGLIGRLFYDFGIPFRLGIEAVFVLAAILVLRALFTWPWQSWLSLGLFIFIIFDPAMAELFSHLFSDQVWLVETMIGFSCVVFALENESRPNWVLLNVAAILLGLSTLTRSVFVPLTLGLVAFAVMAGLLAFLKARDRKSSSSLGALMLSMASLLLVIGIIYGGTCFYNGRVHGYHGISAIDSNEFKKFYFCLQSVGEPTGKRYFPIDEQRRELIAQAGPVSNRFMGEMDGTGAFKQIGLQHYGTADIAAGWLEFAIFTDAYQATDGDLRQCFALFATIENEIAESNRRGLIKVRPIIPLPDTRIPIVAAAYPGALLATVGKIGHEPPPAAFAAGPMHRYTDRDFTVALTRRPVVESPLRDYLWHLLCRIYGCFDTPLVVYGYLLVWIGFLVAVVVHWKKINAFSLSWLACQLFGLFFIVFTLWYALFDASGWPVLSRYMIYNHVMLPVLLAYYLCALPRLVRKGVLQERDPA